MSLSKQFNLNRIKFDAIRATLDSFQVNLRTYKTAVEGLHVAANFAVGVLRGFISAGAFV